MLDAFRRLADEFGVIADQNTPPLDSGFARPGARAGGIAFAYTEAARHLRYAIDEEAEEASEVGADKRRIAELEEELRVRPQREEKQAEAIANLHETIGEQHRALLETAKENDRLRREHGLPELDRRVKLLEKGNGILWGMLERSENNDCGTTPDEVEAHVAEAGYPWPLMKERVLDERPLFDCRGCKTYDLCDQCMQDGVQFGI